MTTAELKAEMSEFLDEEYPKGESENRGMAMLVLAQYITWLNKRVNNNLNV